MMHSVYYMTIIIIIIIIIYSYSKSLGQLIVYGYVGVVLVIN